MANKNRMQYMINTISSIKGKKATPASGNFKASGARIEFRGSFIDSSFNEELGFNTDTENNIAFLIQCEDSEVASLGSLLEVIKKQQSSGKEIELTLDGGLPQYGDYKTLFTVNLDVTAHDFKKAYESKIK